MTTLSKKLKNKTGLAASSLMVTAMTAAVSVYAGHYVSVTAPGSVLALAVPVGISTVQQMLVMAWSEFSLQPKMAECVKAEASYSQPSKGNDHANA